MIAVAATLFAMMVRVENEPSIKVTVDSVKKDVVKGSVVVSLPEGWHAYQNPPKSKYENPLALSSKTKGFTLSKVVYPKGKAMNSFGNDTLVYEGDVKIAFEGKIGKTVKMKNGAYTFDFDIAYQICNESTCQPPANSKASITVKPSK